MSNDLISRKSLIENLEKWCGKQRYLIPNEVWDIIKNAPTAYDVDAVCEEIRKNAIDEISIRNKHDLRVRDTSKWWLHDQKRSAYHNSIEIVRNGGKKQ